MEDEGLVILGAVENQRHENGNSQFAWKRLERSTTQAIGRYSELLIRPMLASWVTPTKGYETALHLRSPGTTVCRRCEDVQ